MINYFREKRGGKEEKGGEGEERERRGVLISSPFSVQNISH